MRLVFGDRATENWLGRSIPVGEIVESAAKEWFRRHLRFVDVDRHLVMQNAIHPGSVELSGTLMRKIPAANDTSAAVGYAPLSETERIVIAAEQFLNSKEFKSRRPETGEDVKVMAVRRGRIVDLTVAVAFVDQLVTSVRSYFQTKLEIEAELRQHLLGNLQDLDDLHVGLNTAG
jgi:S-adenosylmethionine synthetase